MLGKFSKKEVTLDLALEGCMRVEGEVRSFQAINGTDVKDSWDRWKAWCSEKIKEFHVYLRECLEIGLCRFLNASLQSWTLKQTKSFQVRSVFAWETSSLSFWNHFLAPVQFPESVCNHQIHAGVWEKVGHRNQSDSINWLRNWDTTQRWPNKLLSGSYYIQE